MRVVKLPNGNLIVPKRAENDDGSVIGDSFEEITPSHPQYQVWLPFAADAPKDTEKDE